jgi:hypothetical protein
MSVPDWRLTIRLPKDASNKERFQEFTSRDAEGESDRTGTLRIWSDPADGLAKGMTVRMTRTPRSPGVGWHLSVENRGAAALWEVTFPEVHTKAKKEDTILLPSISGSVHPANEPLDYASTTQTHYPSGSLSMQCAALYGPNGGTYIGVHDPGASGKRLTVTCTNRDFDLRWHWPVAEMGIPGTSWDMPGEVLIRPFTGDWFDVAQIYRGWVSEKADWWPRGTQAGRPDTPDWFKDNPLWVMSNGPWPNREAPLPMDQAADKIEKFARYMDDIPCAVHMYNWHQIPYDTEYPHYFPAKEGFETAIRRLQTLSVRVMPYINARIWDTALEDFKEHGHTAAIKGEDGSLKTEAYEGNTLACMCPSTPLWRQTLSDLVRKLTGPEVGADGVYLDQISAQASLPCFDPNHSHLPGGGDWWTREGYWPLLETIRRSVPGIALTSESAAEPYVNRLDGYLTWGGFRNGNRGVPLFHAVYAGQVQLFGRLYKWQSWKGVAMRTKTAQALVWGEQLGWIIPDIIHEPMDAAFLKRLARVRYTLRSYLARGRMVRPPKLETDGTLLTSNWVFASDIEVTTPAVVAGAWRHELTWALALILVNTDTKPHTVGLPFDAAEHGGSGELVAREWIATEAPVDLPDPTPVGSAWTREMTLEPLEARIIEIGEPGIISSTQNGELDNL